MDGKSLARRVAEGVAVMGLVSACSSAPAPTPEIRYLPATPGTGTAPALPDNGLQSFQIATAVPTVTPTETPAIAQTCEKAEQIVWAPVSVKDPKTGKIVEVPIDFEVDGTEKGSVTLINYWGPGITPANTEYWELSGDKGLDLSGIGIDSKGNLVPPVEPRRLDFEGAGTTWRWNTQVALGGCGVTEISREIADHLSRRESEGITVLWETPEQLDKLFPGAVKPLQGDGVSR
jgi:hypothetical protein